MTYPKRLIEVDLPIKRISAHARREKSIRHGHISTLHIWWARRPLAACRAVICAALWPDPADPLCPPAVPRRAAQHVIAFAKAIPTAREQRTATAVPEAVRWETGAGLTPRPERPTHRTSCASRCSTSSPTSPTGTTRPSPTTWRPAARSPRRPTKPSAASRARGRWSSIRSPAAARIPLEALRVGADAFASDLNPVAVLLNKVVLEYIPKYGQRLADEVRKWGAVDQGAGREGTGRVLSRRTRTARRPIAYLWARTIRCEGPGCGAEVPLMRSLWLAKKGEPLGGPEDRAETAGKRSRLR